MRRERCLLRHARLLAAPLAALAVAPGASPAMEATAAPAPCHAVVARGVLPAWARGGFHPANQKVPHVVGRSGQIVAVLFGYPLRARPGPRRTNKILWVSRTDAKMPAALWIRAQQMKGSTPVGSPVGRVLMGGPGPSVVDMPRVGCWRLTLTWSGRRDTLDLAYGTGA